MGRCGERPCGDASRIQGRHKAWWLLHIFKRLVHWTICFSKTDHMHDLGLGLFINRYEFGRPL